MLLLSKCIILRFYGIKNTSKTWKWQTTLGWMESFNLLFHPLCQCPVLLPWRFKAQVKVLSVFIHPFPYFLWIIITGFSEVGGYEGLKEKYMKAMSNDTLSSNSSCGRPREDSFIMLRDPVNSDMPWAGFLFGQTIASIWYWCADQVTTQLAIL